VCSPSPVAARQLPAKVSQHLLRQAGGDGSATGGGQTGDRVFSLGGGAGNGGRGTWKGGYTSTQTGKGGDEWGGGGGRGPEGVRGRAHGVSEK
jgi:hypothetical protein